MLTERLSLLPETLGVFLKYNLSRRWTSRPFIPKSLLYVATHRCNARCIMCGIWRDKSAFSNQLSPEQLEKITKDSLFASLKYVSINGGEPFLRNDIAEIAAVFHQRCRHLKRLSITSNGTLTEKIKSEIPQLLKISHQHDTLLSISISCHACNDLLNRIYGIDNAIEKVQNTIEILQDYFRRKELTLSLNAVLLNDNLDQARSLAAWAKNQQIPITFVVGELRERFHNDDMRKVFIGPERKDELLSFFKEQCLNRSPKDFSVLRYQELIKLLTSQAERTLPCNYALGGAMLGYDGQLYYCSHSKAIGNCLDQSAFKIYFNSLNQLYRRQELLHKECLKCPPYTLTRWELQTIVDRLMGTIVKQKFNSLVEVFRKH